DSGRDSEFAIIAEPTGVTSSAIVASNSTVSSTTTRWGSPGTSVVPMACSTVRSAESSAVAPSLPLQAARVEVSASARNAATSVRVLVRIGTDGERSIVLLYSQMKGEGMRFCASFPAELGRRRARLHGDSTGLA